MQMSAFNSLYWDFCSVSHGYTRLLSLGKVIPFQFPLLGFLFCIKIDDGWVYGAIADLSIPFIGIFVLYLGWLELISFAILYSFNSLYWDFCSVSIVLVRCSCCIAYCFQFPLLGFLFCIDLGGFKVLDIAFNFQFPLLGFLFCIRGFFQLLLDCLLLLSIPFIGIFVLYQAKFQYYIAKYESGFQFPLLGFLFCISMLRVNAFTINAMTFNSLYWDFCSVSQVLRTNKFNIFIYVSFNSLYWDFCSVSRSNLQILHTSNVGISLSIPFIGIFVLYRCRINWWGTVWVFKLSIPFIGIFVLYLFLFDSKTFFS